MSDTYQRILKYFDSANVLGVTATPDRSDQKNLGQFFDSKAYEYYLVAEELVTDCILSFQALFFKI